MSYFVGNIIRREIPAYVAQIWDNFPVFYKGKWVLVVDVIWRDRGCPIRENAKQLEFDTEEEVRRIQVGMKVDSRTKLEWL